MNEYEHQKDPYFDPKKAPISSGGGVQIVRPDSSRGGCQMIGDNNRMKVVNYVPDERPIYVIGWGSVFSALGFILFVAFLFALFVEFVKVVQDALDFLKAHKQATIFAIWLIAVFGGLLFYVIRKLLGDDEDDYDWV